jgi:hypothetical protein
MAENDHNTDNTATADQTTTTDAAIDAAKGFIAQAQETLSEAVSTVVEKVKENPKAAAAIAAGAAATVAGAAYGVSKLREGDTAPKGNAKKK